MAGWGAFRGKSLCAGWPHRAPAGYNGLLRLRQRAIRNLATRDSSGDLEQVHVRGMNRRGLRLELVAGLGIGAGAAYAAGGGERAERSHRNLNERSDQRSGRTNQDRRSINGDWCRWSSGLRCRIDCRGRQATGTGCFEPVGTGFRGVEPGRAASTIFAPFTAAIQRTWLRLQFPLWYRLRPAAHRALV